MKIERLKKYILPAGLFCAGLIALSALRSTETMAPGAAAGQIQVEVVDGESETPLAGCTVVIPETGGSYVTGEDGKTEAISVPILEDDVYKTILRKPWGEITLLIYRDGYIPYALFHTQIYENTARQGPKIYLFQQDSTGSDQPFTVVEGPQRLWVNELIEKFQP